MRTTPRGTVTIALTCALAAFSGCRDAALAVGGTPAHARTNATDLLGALGSWSGPTQLDSSWAVVRNKLAQSPLVPSRIYNDPAPWTATTADSRRLELAGTSVGDRYILGARADAPAPSRPADYRHTLILRKLADNQYEWRGRDELALGSVPAHDLNAAATALLSDAASMNETVIRTSYREGMPRTTAILDRLFTLDTLRTTPGADGATAVVLGISIHPERLAPTAPNLARYLGKYVGPATYHVVAYDDQGAQWWEASAARSRLSLRMRVSNGSLAPLDAPPRRMPSTLHVRADLTAKVGMFTVGVRSLAGDVTLTRAEHEKGFSATFRQPPGWILPPLVGTLIKTPLRRPFEGDGTLLAYAVRDSAGAQTLVTRDYRIAVQESAILRFFNRLGNASVNDFRSSGAEAESEKFLGDVFAAMQADVISLIVSAMTR